MLEEEVAAIGGTYPVSLATGEEAVSLRSDGRVSEAKAEEERGRAEAQGDALARPALDRMRVFRERLKLVRAKPSRVPVDQVIGGER